MIIGVMSDTHNNIENTRRALEIFTQHQVERVIHCGDISTPRIIDLFDRWHSTFVFGNIDHHHADMMLVAKQQMGIGKIGYYYTANWDGIRIAICHGHVQEQLREFITSGLYHYVFHGHTHERRNELVMATRVINPGALGGRRKETRSVCILDTDTDEVTFVELPDDE